MADKKADKKPVATQKFGDDRKKALEVALGKIEKDFGKGSVMKLGDSANHLQVEVIPTGCLHLDFALGVGGLPRGRIVEIYGPESSGKTTFALHCIAEAQKLGGTAAFIDAEHALDPVYAQKLGVDINELYVSQPDNGEQALDICEALVRSGAIDVVVIDSVAALVPKAEIEGDMGDSHVGLQARLMSQALRKLAGVIAKTNAIAIFINQLREKVGVVYGNPETTTGGKALKFYASVRLDIRKGEPIKNGTEIIGNRTKIKIVKNKVAPPFQHMRGGHALWRGHLPRRRAARPRGGARHDSRSPARSTPTRASASARAATTHASTSRNTPRCSRRSSRSCAPSSPPTPTKSRWTWPPAIPTRPAMRTNRSTTSLKSDLRQLTSGASWLKRRFSLSKKSF